MNDKINHMSKNKNLFRKQKGFTLIELLVAISIIGTLVGLIVNNMADARARARDSKRKSNLTQLKTALRLYYNDYQQYPAGNGVTIEGCGTDGDETCPDDLWSAGLPASPTIYMKQLPEDINYYSDALGIDTDSFIAKVTLENASDPDILSSQNTCPCSGCSYDTTEFIVCAD